MKARRRTWPDVRVRQASPNRSSRQGAPLALFVVHATAGHNRPGISDLQGLAGWFANPNSQVSSHTASDNEGRSARFVADQAKAWHVAAFNRLAYGHEQIIPGDGSELTRDLYHETARWIAYISLKHDLPIRKAKVDLRTLRVLRTGVIRHSELGAPGGGHADPGPYNLRQVLHLARHYKRRMRRAKT